MSAAMLPDWPAWQLTTWQLDEPTHELNSDVANAKGIKFALEEKWKMAEVMFERATSISNQYHHYIHYTCSAIYTLAAEVMHILEQPDTVSPLIKSALFQDHTNARALAMQAGEFSKLPLYDVDLATDAQWMHAIRLPDASHQKSATTSLLDEAYRAISRGEYQIAIAALRVARTTTPDISASGKMPRLLMHHARARLGLKQYKEALSAITQAIESAKIWHHTYHRQAALHRLHLGRAMAMQGNWLMACDHFRQALDIDPPHPEGWEARARAYIALENQAAAQKDLAKAQSLRQKLEFSARAS